MSTLEGLPLESLPLGFRFCPTDVELINQYLKRKINGRIKADIAVIPEVDVCRCEPWDLPAKSLIKSKDPEWFFFAPKDRKYSNGSRSNRATEAGYWKATGNDRSIKTRPPSPVLIGMKKTLVFYLGRAPRGKRTRWIMHEYRTVEADFQQGDFVLCRLFEKSEEKNPTSNADEMDSSGLSPALTRPSPDAMANGDDSVDEFTTPLPPEFEPSNLDEIVEEWIAKSVETQSYSDVTTDICASGIHMDNIMDYPVPSDLRNLDPEFEPNGSDLFYYNSPSDYYLNFLSFDDNGVGVPAKDEAADSELVNDLLDAILVNNEEENPTETVPVSQVCPTKHESPLDADIDDLLLQEDLGFVSSSQLRRPMSPSSYLTSPEYNLLAIEFDHSENKAADELQCNLLSAKDMFESCDDEPNNLSHDLPKNEPDPSNADNPAEIRIKIRPRRLQVSANPNQQGHPAMAVHGNAVRRIRLQTSLHPRSTVIADGKSNSADGGHVEKSEMSESGEKTDFEGPSLREAPKAATVYFGRVTVVILSILCIGIGWFFTSR